MNLARALVLGFCLASLAACASPPYASPGVDRATAMADYQDCYSKGCLAHFTPELKASANKTARACMKERGYTETGTFPWW